MNGKRWLTGISWLGISTLVGGCSGGSTAHDRGEAVSVDQGALNGIVNWGTFTGPNCLQKEQAFKASFGQAFSDVLVPYLVNDPTAMSECMKDAILSGEEEWPSEGAHAEITFPENIIETMRQNLPTTINCDDSFGWQCQSAGRGGFTCGPIYADSWYVNNAQMALHELAHGDWDHPEHVFDSAAAVNNQLMNCIASVYASNGQWGVPGGARRNSNGTAETTLAQVGREYGLPATSAFCGPNQFLGGFYGNASAKIDWLSGTCRDLYGSAESDLPGTGAFGGTYFRTTCNWDEVAVGAWGWAGDYLGSIGRICARISDVQAGSYTRSWSPLIGGTVGVPWNRVCPPYHALKGLRMRSLSEVTRLELVCENITDGQAIRTRDLDWIRSAGSYVYLENCVSRAVATGLTVGVGSDALLRIGGACQGVVSVPPPAPASTIALATDQSAHVLPSHGGNQGSPSLDLCPAGEGVVGVDLQLSGSRPTGINALCVPVDTWSRGTYVTPDATPLRGTVGTPLQRVCTVPEFLVGWTIATGSDEVGRGVVHDLVPVCRSFGN